MKICKSKFFSILIIISISGIDISLYASSMKQLTVYLPSTYYQWIRTLKAVDKFKRDNNCSIRFISFDGSRKILGRLILEKINPRADIVMGLSKTTFLKAKKMGLLSKYRPKNYEKIEKNLVIDKDWYGVPFDYGKLAIICKKSEYKGKLKSLSDLLKFKRSIIIQDPRSSTTGEAFLLWTIAVYKNRWVDFWKRLKKSIFTIAPSWSSAFSQYELSSVKFMISYASDEAYAYHRYNKSKYRVLIPESGAYLLFELNAIVKRARDQQMDNIAKKFIDLMLTEEVQRQIPLNNWMLPVIKVKLPEIFLKYYPIKGKIVSIDNVLLEKNIDSWLKTWGKIEIE